MIRCFFLFGLLLFFCTPSLSVAGQIQNELHFASGQSLDRIHPTIAAALLKEAFGRQGIKLIFHSYPTKRSYLLVNRGEIDGEMHRVRNFIELVGKDAENLVRIETKLFDVFFAVFAKHQNGKQIINSVNDLVGFNVAYRDGRKNAQALLAPLETQINIDTPHSDEAAFKMLARGRVDFVLAGSWESKLTLSQSPQEYKDIEEVGRLSQVGLYAYVNKKHEELSKEISRTLVEMNSEGTTEKIISSIIDNPQQ